MRSWQIRNILTTVALAVWCGVATAGPESAGPPPAPEAQSETKQSKTEAASETEKSTTAAETKNTSATTKKKPAAAATKKSTASEKSTKATTTAKAKTAAQPKTKKAATPAKPATAAPVKAPAPGKAAAPAHPKPVRIAAPGKQRTVPHHVTGGGVGVLPRVDAPASTTPDVGLQGIKDRARWAPADVCEDTDKKLQGTMRAIDKEASKNGDRLVMARMAAQFRIPAETVLAERARLSAPWGELMVAHTLLANARGVTADQLFDMRAEGMGWGQIAWGLGFKPKDVATAVQTEGKVIRGQSKPDGSPSKITSVEPQLAAEETAHSGGSSTPDVGVKVETAVPEPVAK